MPLDPHDLDGELAAVAAVPDADLQPDAGGELLDTITEWAKAPALAAITRLLVLLFGTSVVTGLLGWVNQLTGLNLSTAALIAVLAPPLVGLVLMAGAYIFNHGRGLSKALAIPAVQQLITEAAEERVVANVQARVEAAAAIPREAIPAPDPSWVGEPTS